MQKVWCSMAQQSCRISFSVTLGTCSHCVRFAYWILANRLRRVEFTLLTNDPTRTCRCVHTVSTSRPPVTQLHVLNSWNISRFSGHVSIVSGVSHALTKETSGNRFSAVIWPISTSCIVISQRITSTPQRHDFYTLNSQHYKLMEWKEICQSAVNGTLLANRKRSLARSHCSAKPTRTVRVHCDTSRCGLSVPVEPDALDVVCTRATGCVPFANGTHIG